MSQEQLADRAGVDRKLIYGTELGQTSPEFDQGKDLDGYVWGVSWQVLYPGMKLVSRSAEADEWEASLAMPFHEAVIETNGHNLSLMFSDLIVDVAEPGHAPFVVPKPGPTSRCRSLS